MSSRIDAKLSDAELIAKVRDGHTDAYGVLFARHRAAAERLAEQLVKGPDRDDLVAEAFTRILMLLELGSGPEDSFRAYLLTSIRHLHVDRIRKLQRERPTDNQAELDRQVSFIDPSQMRFEHSAAALAFASLPDRWQMVLWHLDVEGDKPADIAPLLDMSPNSVSALAYRAREGLRQAYVQQHVGKGIDEECRWTTSRLGGYVRAGLSKRDTGKVDKHLDDCRSCMGLYLELAEINESLSAVLGPIVLGGAFVGYLSAGSSALAGLSAPLLGSIKSISGTVGPQGMLSAGLVATVAAVGVVVSTNGIGESRLPQSIPEPGVQAAPVPAVPNASPKAGPSASSIPTSRPQASPPVFREPPVQVPNTSTESSSSSEPSAEVPGSSSEPNPRPDSGPPPNPEPIPEPTDAPEPSPTDYALASVGYVNDSTYLQRRFSFEIAARAEGLAIARKVAISLDFKQFVRYRGVVTPGWDCGASHRNETLKTLRCESVLPAGTGSAFVVKIQGSRPAGTATVFEPDDPQSGNNSMDFQSGAWYLPL